MRHRMLVADSVYCNACIDEQEATRRSSANAKKNSAAAAEILKGNPKYLGASLAQGHA